MPFQEPMMWLGQFRIHHLYVLYLTIYRHHQSLPYVQYLLQDQQHAAVYSIPQNFDVVSNAFASFDYFDHNIFIRSWKIPFFLNAHALWKKNILILKIWVHYFFQKNKFNFTDLGRTRFIYIRVDKFYYIWFLRTISQSHIQTNFFQSLQPTGCEQVLLNCFYGSSARKQSSQSEANSLQLTRSACFLTYVHGCPMPAY